MERGFFKIYRKIEDSKSWSRGALYRGLMITLLEKANWKRGFFHGQEILPGQLAFSGECLADELDIPRTSVVRMLRNLELDGFLTRSNMNNRYTLITITNWHSYQGVENDGGQPMVNQRSTDGQPVDTIKEGKKERRHTPPPPPHGGDASGVAGECSSGVMPQSGQARESRKRFMPPKASEVEAYCLERGNGIDPVAFVDFYEAKGWCVGKTPMKDWKAAVRTWEHERREKRAMQEQAYAMPLN
ncbi:hypothetical protein [Bilophila wadsworthia]|uniref:hypothetical protein n=1 Tax=Bilophila wadsworthia TaxID=35833 RepID=UPI003AB6E25F